MRKNKEQIKKKKKQAKKKGPNLKARAMCIGAVLFVLFGVLSVRLAQLTLFSGEKVAKFSERQRFRSVKLHAPRGNLYDRNLNELAVSIPLMSAYINPQRIKGGKNTLRILATNLEPKNIKRRNHLFRRLIKRLKRSSDKSFIWVRRKLTPEIYTVLKKKDLKGVGFVREYKRFYPKRDVAAKIIGFCGIDNQGLYGLEHQYDEVIEPVNSKTVVRKDAFGRPISMPHTLDVADSAKPMDIVLTIDERLQYITEKALERKVINTGAKGGVAIVMDPHTGEILAMAEQPKFNPNNYSRYKSGLWKPHAVSHAVEPGSTLKVFVAAAALEERLTSARDVIYCEKGQYQVAGKTFREAHKLKYGDLTLPQVISKSSNIGAIKLAERLGQEKLYSYLTSFGFGSKTGIDLPGESSGLLRTTSNWSRLSLPSISFGQEVAVTPIQLATGMSVFANGGYLVRPRLVRAFMRDGKPVKLLKPQVRSKVISEATVKTVVEMMEGVVSSGTGKKASLAGFEVAGKTGTAQKIDSSTGSYSNDKFLASFAGFFPAREPRLVILVMVDEPKGVAWGGSVAGPVFSEIASRSARALRIPGSETDVYEIDWSKMVHSGGGDRVESSNEVVGDVSKAGFAKKSGLERLLSVFQSVRQMI